MFSSGTNVILLDGKATLRDMCSPEGGAAREILIRDSNLPAYKPVPGNKADLRRYFRRTPSSSQPHINMKDLEGDIGAEDLQLLMRASADLETGVTQKDRYWYFTLYEKCWVASQMVAWLVDEGHCYDEDEAVERCVEAQRKGFIVHVVDSKKKFKNEKLYYWFTSKVFEKLDPGAGAGDTQSEESEDGVDGSGAESEESGGGGSGAESEEADKGGGVEEPAAGGRLGGSTRGARAETSVAMGTGRHRGEIVLKPPPGLAASESTLAEKSSDELHGHTGKPTANDFNFVRVIGEGAYAQVWLVSFKATTEQFAIKQLDKLHIVKEKKVHEVNREKEILEMVDHPFIIRLHGTFQDHSSLYFVLEYCPNKTLLEHIQNAVEYLQSLDILHRDIKPENMLLDKHNHLKLADFGTSTRLGGKRERKSRATSFVGTAEYIAPELLKRHYSNKSSDIWALGCVAYQFIAGEVPFRGDSDFLTFEKIASGEIEFPGAFPEVARDFVNAVLVADDAKRLGAGAGGFAALQSHPIFEGIVWRGLPYSPPPKLEAGPVQKVFKRKKDLIKETKESKWNIFLLSGSRPELILKEGLVHKRKHRVSRPKKRQLILTDFPRLLYADPDANCLKGEVEWTHMLGVEQKTASHFAIHTPHRRYNFEGLDKNAKSWCEAISRVQKDKCIPAHKKSNPRLRVSAPGKKSDSGVKRSPQRRGSKSPKRDGKSPKGKRSSRSSSAKKRGGDDGAS